MSTLWNRRGTVSVLMSLFMLGMMIYLAGLLELGAGRDVFLEAQRAADAAALAGVSAFKEEPDLFGTLARARAESILKENTVAGKEAQAAEILVYPDSHVVVVRIVARSWPGLLFRDGVPVSATTTARVDVSEKGQGGTPIPPGNAYGWYKNYGEAASPHDSIASHIIQ